MKKFYEVTFNNEMLLLIYHLFMYVSSNVTQIYATVCLDLLENPSKQGIPHIAHSPRVICL